MPKPLSTDIRHRLVQAVEDGVSRRSAANRFGVAPSTAVKWVAVWRQTGSFEPRPLGGDRRSHRIEQYAEDILTLVHDTPDMTLAELAVHLNETHGLKVSQSMVWRLLDRHGFTLKKNGARQRTTTS